MATLFEDVFHVAVSAIVDYPIVIMVVYVKGGKNGVDLIIKEDDAMRLFDLLVDPGKSDSIIITCHDGREYRASWDNGQWFTIRDRTGNTAPINIPRKFSLILSEKILEKIEGTRVTQIVEDPLAGAKHRMDENLRYMFE